MMQMQGYRDRKRIWPEKQALTGKKATRSGWPFPCGGQGAGRAGKQSGKTERGQALSPQAYQTKPFQWQPFFSLHWQAVKPEDVWPVKPILAAWFCSPV